MSFLSCCALELHHRSAREALCGSTRRSSAMAAMGALCCSTTSNHALLQCRHRTQSSRAFLELRLAGFRASSCRQQIISLSSCQRALPSLARDGDLRRTGSTGRREKLWRLVPNASVTEEQQPQQADDVLSSLPTLKDFLEDLKPLGRVRLIVNTGVAVLESVTSFEKFFYHTGPRGEYANIMSRDDNVDFHLLLAKVALVRLVRGKSPKDIPTYMVRLVNVNDSVAVSVLLMWRLGTDGEYDPGQVEAFQALLNKYGEEYKFPSIPQQST